MSKRGTLTAQQKKERGLIALLGIVALVMLIFCYNAFGGESNTTPAVNTTTSGTMQTTLPVSTTVPAAETTVKQDATKAPETTTSADETTAPAQEPVNEKAEILKVVSDSVNLLKSPESSFAAHKVQSINIKLVDSSIPSMNNFVNGIINMFVKTEELDYDFINGVSDNPEGDGTVEADDEFPPGDMAFTLTEEGVASATKTTEGENTVYSVVIVAETSTLENPRPPHHNAGADTLDLSSIEIPVAKITKADFEYPGATISITLNPEGKIVGYYERLVINGTGEATALGLTGYGTIDGYLDEKWDITMK